MATEKPDFIPVLIGGDMNCYSVARAIHEEYGVKSYAFGRFPRATPCIAASWSASMTSIWTSPKWCWRR